MKGLIVALSLAAAAALAPATAEATVRVFGVFLSGPDESPPNASPGTGSATVTFDDVLNIMTLDMSFSGLLGTTTASHIHAGTPTPGTGTAGVATTTPSFPGFPLGVTSGSYQHTFDMTDAGSYNPAYVTAHGGTAAEAEAALLASMVAGTSYLNIHTNLFPSGEIRGFLIAAPAPEPAAWVLMIAGFGAAGAMARRRRRRRLTA